MKVNSQQPVIKEFNGQSVTLHLNADKQPTIGASGTTKLYNLTSGGGLFLRDDEVTA